MIYFNATPESERLALSSETQSFHTETLDSPSYTPEQLLQQRRHMDKDRYYGLVREMALDHAELILEHWLPDGEQRGREYVALNPLRLDGEPGSFSINTETGVWADFAIDEQGADLVSLVKYLDQLEYYSEAAERILTLLSGSSTVRPVTTRSVVAAPSSVQEPEYTPVMPIPDDPVVAHKQPRFFGADLGSPAHEWCYRNAQGQPMLYVLRFNLRDGSKQYRPLSYCKDSSGFGSWRNQAPSTNRPLYGLDRLAANPEATVIITEGEKAADAAQRFFPDCVAMTTMNGAKSPTKTDFSPLAGRRVSIAPDHDEAGEGYKNKIIELVTAAGGMVVSILNNAALAKEGDVPQGFDLADAEEAGWTSEQLQALGDALWEPVEPLPEPETQTTTLPASPQSVSQPVTSNQEKSFSAGVREIVEALFGGLIRYVGGRPYLYREGYWPSVDETVFVQKPLTESLAGFGKKDTPTSVNAHMQTIRTLYAEDEQRWATSHLLCLANGALDPASGILHPHSPEHHLVNKVSITYDLAATCPLWLQTLDEIFAFDADKAEKIQLLQEYIGYCLVPDTRMCKFLWMVGGGGNGKSLLLSILTALIGHNNVSNAQIERLDRPFVRAELQGKLVNISSEMSAQATVADGYLKQIVSGDMIEAERKYEKPFSFKPYARLIAATNNLPRLLDHSEGFCRRAIILRFNRQFTEQDRDINREQNLMAELPGILNWALAGLQSLYARGRFVIPASSEQEIHGYRVESDPVRQFADEFMEQSETQTTPSAELYAEYREWSAENGYQPLASNSFATRLEGIGFTKIRTRSGRFWNSRLRSYGDCSPNEVSISPLAANYQV